jgi:hypothetical protein
MINSRHILNLSIELITKPQALGRTSCYKCNVLFFKKVLKSKNSLKSLIFKKVKKVKKS